jgi:hypothetical protein
VFYSLLKRERQFAIDYVLHERSKASNFPNRSPFLTVSWPFLRVFKGHLFWKSSETVKNVHEIGRIGAFESERIVENVYRTVTLTLQKRTRATEIITVKNLISFRLRYRPVTVTPSPWSTVDHRYLTVTDRPPLPTVTDLYSSLPLVTVTSNGQ